MKMTKTLFVVIAGLCFSLAACSNSTGQIEKERTTVSNPEDSIVIKDSTYSVQEVEETIDSLKNKMDSVLIIKENLVSEVGDYIKSVAPRSKMSALNIVDICIEHDYDITLLLCQGHLETHFGTAGRNVFGIVGQRHSHPDKYVQGYVDLMKSKYIIDRTTEQLLAANVNMEKNRTAKYAGNPQYGKLLSGIRKDILNNTNIMPLFRQLQTLRNELTQTNT